MVMKAPLPPDEPERLENLRAYNILDTLPERDYDDLTLLASRICNTPVALMTLLDEHRQWFKSKVGWDVAETHRDLAFCGHAILQEEVFVVPDALEDKRFADNPLVTANPKIRFYAGAPLVTPEHHALGTLCVIDQQPRTLSEEQREALAALGRQVVTQLELRRARRMAEAASRAKSQFLANMSHELRTPLNAILGYAEMLEEEARDLRQERFVSDLQKIRSAGKHLLTMISEILDLSKAESGRMTLCVERFDVEALVRSVIDTIRPLTERNGNTLRVECGAGLGTMNSDGGKVRQCLVNLLGNAAKFTHQGSITFSTSRQRQENREWVLFVIRDSGIGMTSEQLERAFEPFTQADDSTARRYGGTGLGLTISRQFARLLGGELTAESEVGKGSVFTMRLPAEVRRPQGPPTDTGQVCQGEAV